MLKKLMALIVVVFFFTKISTKHLAMTNLGMIITAELHIDS
jgi:hypothetical protein